MYCEWEINNPEDPNHPAQYDRLPDDQKQMLQDWIGDRIKPVQSYNHLRTSYGLKHDLHWDTGLYVNNGAFKGGMTAAGYKPDSRVKINPSYKMRLVSRTKRGQERQAQGWWAKARGIQVVYDPHGKPSLTRIQERPSE